MKKISFYVGRSDDVINVSGHRVSTAEWNLNFYLMKLIESAVGVDDVITGSKLVLFYVSNKIKLDSNQIKIFLQKNWCIPPSMEGNKNYLSS